ncbi:HdeD family acid-resistance protein [Actinokineospora diospyrosa]|uniref:Uncharacterized membrane protein HdeD, DUF308 family n=1 Tax=Actinokineospora diospyrosa TaxID=103728 RepID=A0ABT1IJD8_9PSEU|nr:DUF308 domain-containing protein [Actinokineospora diospyrosa]MCP2272658.1 Uncharacterized membrane protein HdeD, DUF308 family [Actinokineospora diospyrosa]
MSEERAVAAGVPGVRVDPVGGPRRVIGAGSSRGLGVLNGVLMVGVGIAALVWPEASLVLLALLFAITLLANGVVRVLQAITDGSESGGGRVLLGVLGAFSLLVGLLCLRSPSQTLALFAVLVGSWWLVGGVLAVVAALGDRGGEGRGWSVALGVLSAVAGGYVLLQPGISLAALELALGVSLIVLGAITAVEAVRARPTDG